MNIVPFMTANELVYAGALGRNGADGRNGQTDVAAGVALRSWDGAATAGTVGMAVTDRMAGVAAPDPTCGSLRAKFAPSTTRNA